MIYEGGRREKRIFRRNGGGLIKGGHTLWKERDCKKEALRQMEQ